MRDEPPSLGVSVTPVGAWSCGRFDGPLLPDGGAASSGPFDVPRRPGPVAGPPGVLPVPGPAP
ncbi:hypothetical protein, partial [Pseudonocardia sp.]|uniref:hypothetical protein n=1 Tax=Pseudonocardia sp. TaxID=60912 RepID=UPI0026256CB3